MASHDMMVYKIITLLLSSHSVAKDGHKNVVCTTVPEAELQIVSLLQEKFLDLLGRFR